MRENEGKGGGWRWRSREGDGGGEDWGKKSGEQICEGECVKSEKKKMIFG